MRARRFFLALIAASVPYAASALGRSTPGMFLDEPPIPPRVISPESKDGAAVFTADEIGYDQKNGIVVARGNVEVMQGGTIVTTDQVTYYQQRDVVVAEGNVVMMQPSGDVLFAERAELNDALKTGVVDTFKVRMADHSVLVADSAAKESNAVTRLKNAEYTPCNLCEDAAPFWQLNAGDAKIDQAAERVTYHNATLDVAGVPILYTPYLSHPTPDAQARSGFMPPQYSTSSNLGTMVKVPYYWRIGHDKDMIVTPSFSTQEGLLMRGDYHQLTNGGEYFVQASGTNPERIDSQGDKISGNEFRGHIFARGTESIAEDTNVGFDIQRTSDDTYLRRYSFGDQRVLFSRLFVEQAKNRNHALVQGLAIQGLRTTDNSRATPLVLPMLQGYYETTPDTRGVRYHVSADAQSLTRREGIDQRRLSMTAGAQYPFITDGGHVLTSSLNVRQDVYRTENIPYGPGNVDDTSYRTLPQAAFEWRYPLMNMFESGTLTVEPLALAVVQSSGGNPEEISNEDSRLLELTDTNLFSIDRMPGLDAVDSGPRLAYGMRTQYLMTSGMSVDGLLGQNYNADNTPFPNSTEPDENFSDYIGRVALNINPVTLAYRFAMDKKEFDLSRNEFSFIFAKPWFTMATSYRSVDNNRFLGSSKEGQLDATLPLSDSVSIYGSARRDFDQNQLVSAGSGIVFKNECFNVMFDAARTYTRDRDIEPATEMFLRIAFKNLGEFGGR